MEKFFSFLLLLKVVNRGVKVFGIKFEVFELANLLTKWLVGLCETWSHDVLKKVDKTFLLLEALSGFVLDSIYRFFKLIPLLGCGIKLIPDFKSLMKVIEVSATFLTSEAVEALMCIAWACLFTAHIENSLDWLWETFLALAERGVVCPPLVDGNGGFFPFFFHVDNLFDLGNYNS